MEIRAIRYRERQGPSRDELCRTPLLDRLRTREEIGVQRDDLIAQRDAAQQRNDKPKVQIYEAALAALATYEAEVEDQLE